MNGKRLDGTMLMLTVVLDILATPTLLISGKHIFWDDL